MCTARENEKERERESVCVCAPRTGEQLDGLKQSVGGAVFEHGLVVLRNSGHEDDGSDVIETMDPLPALGFLGEQTHHRESKQARHTRRGKVSEQDQNRRKRFQTNV